MRIIKINFNLIISAIVIAAAILIGYTIVAVQAQVDDIVFPVKELGNCKNEADCKAYCDKPENIVFCVDFAEKHNLISEDEVKKAKAFAKVGKGPGNCKNKEACEEFCERPENIESCLVFAEENDLMSDEELEEARKVSEALKGGVKLPGGCRNKKECELYCDNSEHIEECIAFAEAADLIDDDELEEAKKAMKAIKSGIKPPGNCRGKKQCDVYCSQSEHMEECFNFAEAAGFIDKDEIEEVRRIMPLMIKGEMPGGCRGREECDTYCANDEYFEECANFAVKAGLMDEKESEMFKKTGGKGPGNCRGKDECENFCDNPENQNVCFEFAKEHGLIEKFGPREDFNKMAPRKGEFEEGENDEDEYDENFEEMMPYGEDDLYEKGDSREMPKGMPEKFRNMKPENMPENFKEMMPEGMPEEFMDKKFEGFDGTTPPSEEQIKQIEEIMRQKIMEERMEGNFGSNLYGIFLKFLRGY